MVRNNNRRIIPGWQGRYFEDFEEGDIYKHPYGRTITETDNVWLTNLTMNLNPIHFNKVYAQETEFNERLVNGLVVICVAVGMSVIDVSQNSIANLGYDKIKHHNPVFHGDTIYAESEVKKIRESESREETGIVTTELRAYNSSNDKLLSLERTNLIAKRTSIDISPEKPSGWPSNIGTTKDDIE